MTITSAVQTVIKKGEDTHAILEGEAGATSCFAVFDGHGGKKASAMGVKVLGPTLQKLGVGASDEALWDAFWEADKALGTTTNDGSTATILLTQGDSAGAGHEILLAWVGDSQGCVVDLGQSVESGAPAILAETTRHVADEPQEELRLNQTWQVSRRIRLMAAESRGRLDLTKPDVAAIKQCAIELEFELDDAACALLARAIARGASIDTHKFGAVDLSNAMTSVVAPRVPGGKAFLHKSGGTPTATPDSSVHKGPGLAAGPPAQEQLTQASVATGRVQTVSTAVTRAIGDWDGSRALVPHPEIRRLAVPSSSVVRVVLASDGLWDFVTPAEAAAVLCEEADVAKCAERLKQRAVNRSNAKFNGIKDDITVVVVELNSRGMPPPLLKGSGGGCCSVS